MLGVDWTSLAPYKELAAGLARTGQRVPPYVFMNYRCSCCRQTQRLPSECPAEIAESAALALRVHLRTAAQEDRSFIHGVEAEAAATAVLMTVLSSSDAAFSLDHLARRGGPALRPRVRSALPLLHHTAAAVAPFRLTFRLA